MQTVGSDEVLDVAVAPFLEEAGIAVLALFVNPHVETLGHHHHAEGVIHLHLHLAGAVVGGADGIATHRLEQFHLTDEGGLVDCRSQHAKVVVQADSLELAGLAIQLETTFGRTLDGAETNFLRLFVENAVGGAVADGVERHLQVVEFGILWSPEGHVLHVAKHLCQAAFVGIGQEGLLLSLVVLHAELEGIFLAWLHAGHLRLELFGHLLSDGKCVGHDAPLLDGGLRSLNQRDGADESGTRIPAAAFLHIQQVDSQRVGRPVFVHEGSHIHVERTVAILPFAGFLAVHIHHWLSHGCVEVEQGAWAVLLHCEGGAIPAAANPGQGAGASCLFARFLFAILFDGHGLLVNLFVEGTTDGPVVWHLHRLPLLVVEVHLGRCGWVEFLSTRELPAIAQLDFLALCQGGHGCGHHGGAQQTFEHFLIDSHIYNMCRLVTSDR